MLLQSQVEDDDRQHGKHDDRHRRAQVYRAVASLEVLYVDRDRHVFCPVKYEVREQVVVPHPHCLKDADGNERRFEHRENYVEVCAYRAAAVDRGSFLYLKRQALYEADKHEYRKSGSESQIYYRDGPRCIQLEVVCRECQREHYHLERYDHAEQAEIVERVRKL